MVSNLKSHFVVHDRVLLKSFHISKIFHNLYNISVFFKSINCSFIQLFKLSSFWKANTAAEYVDWTSKILYNNKINKSYKLDERLTPKQLPNHVEKNSKILSFKPILGI